MRYVIVPSDSGLTFLRDTIGDTLVQVAKLLAAGTLSVYVIDRKDGRQYAAGNLLELVQRQ
jgi:hypothetical protein